MKNKHIISLLTLSFILSSCGQTGPLYLPKDENAPQKPLTLSQKLALSDKLDPSKPDTAELQTSSQLVDKNDGFGFNNESIDASSAAGGNPVP